MTAAEQMAEIAREILVLSRNTLLVNLRFLDAAISRFKYIPIMDFTWMTDGQHILYNRQHIINIYKVAKENPTRDYLHIIMHCIFRHMYVEPKINHTYWDLACDIAVENAITDLGLKIVSTEREQGQKQYIRDLKRKMKYLTAEKIYSYLQSAAPDEEQLAKLRKLFYADEHDIWYMSEEDAKAQMQSMGDRVNSEGQQEPYGQEKSSEQHKPDGQQESDGQREHDGQQESNGQQEQNDSKKENSREAMSKEWQEISERIQMDLETFSKQRGLRAGAMSQNLAAVNREKYDYTSFLKKFAVLGETMKINDDEFDYIFYTYGMKLYGKMPLIEPLEYKETKRIREFVIAIDTSGSTSNGLAQRFVQKTYNILKSTESFFSKINLHIIQCDADIQEDAKITCQDDFDKYLKTMRLRGMGGTDFRPVFSYVETLRQSREFTNLKGLIYFTDGYGEFPKRKPDYDTAFVFVEDDYHVPAVPPWAIKLVLQSSEI